jgi:membrane carboxypeptidase/penicillin-binding protein PbpC
MGVPSNHRKSVKWSRPESSRFPKRLTALFITETGCPTYFQTPREDGWAWTKRLLAKTIQGRELDGDGACELIFARMLARRLGALSTLEVAVSADRIHKFLEKDQLVGWNLASMQFDRGLVGVEDASIEVLQKPLNELSDAELAELQLAIPPWGYWDDIHQCKNAGLVKDSRDQLIKHLSSQGLISDEMARTAMAQPVRCMQVKR